MAQTVMVAEGAALTDQISLGVLASWVPRDVVDEAVAVTGRQARRAGGKLPPHVTVYLVMALALFADEDYEEVAARLAGTLRGWDCWDDGWEVPTKGAITQARQRLGAGPVEEVFARVAGPVADLDTAGAFMGPWRLMSLDGMEWDVPDSAANRAAFAPRARPEGPAAFPKIRVVTVSECGSHAVVLAALGGSAAGKGSGEQSLARTLYPQLDPDWLVIADRNFYIFKDWCAAADTGAARLWRVKANTRLPVLDVLPDGSFASVLIDPKISGPARDALITAASAGQDLDPGQGRPVRVIEYGVPDRDGHGETIIVVTTITDWRAAPAQALAGAYHQRWEHETGNAQLKTFLRGPGRVLRSGSPDLARQEIWGYLLTHYALSALICAAATSAGIDPDRVKFKRTLRIVRRAAGPAFPP
jgi:hypothetical protein